MLLLLLLPQSVTIDSWSTAVRIWIRRTLIPITRPEITISITIGSIMTSCVIAGSIRAIAMAFFVKSIPGAISKIMIAISTVSVITIIATIPIILVSIKPIRSRASTIVGCGRSFSSSPRTLIASHVPIEDTH